MAKRATGLSGFAKAAALGAAVALTPAALSAEEAQPTAMTEELVELQEATRQAIAYAEENGVAILLHVGLDIQNHEQSEALLQWVQDEFRRHFAEQGLDVGIFPRMNDAAGSGLVYHVGEHIYSPPGGDPLLNLQEAANLVPDVAEQARIAIQLAAVQTTQLTPRSPGG